MLHVRVQREIIYGVCVCVCVCLLLDLLLRCLFGKKLFFFLWICLFDLHKVGGCAVFNGCLYVGTDVTYLYMNKCVFLSFNHEHYFELVHARTYYYMYVYIAG